MCFRPLWKTGTSWNTGTETIRKTLILYASKGVWCSFIIIVIMINIIIVLASSHWAGNNFRIDIIITKSQKLMTATRQFQHMQMTWLCLASADGLKLCWLLMPPEINEEPKNMHLLVESWHASRQPIQQGHRNMQWAKEGKMMTRGEL